MEVIKWTSIKTGCTIVIACSLVLTAFLFKRAFKNHKPGSSLFLFYFTFRLRNTHDHAEKVTLKNAAIIAHHARFPGILHFFYLGGPHFKQWYVLIHQSNYYQCKNQVHYVNAMYLMV